VVVVPVDPGKANIEIVVDVERFTNVVVLLGMAVKIVTTKGLKEVWDTVEVTVVVLVAAVT
jgi:hypothetical protein